MIERLDDTFDTSWLPQDDTLKDETQDDILKDLESFKSWTLEDFINDMKNWANDISKNKNANRKLWRILNNECMAVTLWLECNLLQREDLRKKLISSPYLLSVKPFADLSFALYNLIMNQFYPKLGYLWEEIAPTHNHLWAYFEYSRFFNQVDEILKGTNLKTKTSCLNNNEILINKIKTILEDVDYYEKRNLNFDNQIYLDLNIEIQTSEKEYESKVCNYFNYLIKKHPISRIAELLTTQFNQLAIKDENFRMHYKYCLNIHENNRLLMKNSTDYQICYIDFDNDRLIISKKGSPEKPKTKRGRGRPPKGSC